MPCPCASGAFPEHAGRGHGIVDGEDNFLDRGREKQVDAVGTRRVSREENAGSVDVRSDSGDGTSFGMRGATITDTAAFVPVMALWRNHAGRASSEDVVMVCRDETANVRFLAVGVDSGKLESHIKEMHFRAPLSSWRAGRGDGRATSRPSRHIVVAGGESGRAKCTYGDSLRYRIRG